MRNADFVLLEIELKKALKIIRDDIKQCETVSSFIFSITASGRPDSDLEVKFSIENQYDSKANVSGGNLQAVLVEYLRRNNWQQFNGPLCLPNVEPKIEKEKTLPEPLPPLAKADVADEIPF